jgi:hypothetical protein
MHQKITHPDDLLELTPQQLFQRTKPILRTGGLCASTQLLARVRQNLNSVCWELARKWHADPRLGDRELTFGEYLAITLANRLRSLDRKQNRHLYDEHGAYQPNREPVALDELDGKHFSFRPSAPTTADRLTPDTWADSFEQTARNASIAQPSITALIQNIRNIETGTTKTPYKLARAEGLSTTDARYQPATAAFIAINDFIAQYNPTFAATAIT